MSLSNRVRIPHIIVVWILGLLLLTWCNRDWLSEPFTIMYTGGIEPGTLEFIEAYWPNRVVEPATLDVRAGEDLLSKWAKAEFMARLVRLAAVAMLLSLSIAVGTWLTCRGRRNMAAPQ